MDTALHAAHTELKATQKDLLKAIHSTPFHADMVQVCSSNPVYASGAWLLASS